MHGLLSGWPSREHGSRRRKLTAAPAAIEGGYIVESNCLIHADLLDNINDRPSEHTAVMHTLMPRERHAERQPPRLHDCVAEGCRCRLSPQGRQDGGLRREYQRRRRARPNLGQHGKVRGTDQPPCRVVQMIISLPQASEAQMCTVLPCVFSWLCWVQCSTS